MAFVTEGVDSVVGGKHLVGDGNRVIPMGRPNPARRGPLGSEAVLLYPWRYYGGLQQGSGRVEPPPPRRLRSLVRTEQRVTTRSRRGGHEPWSVSWAVVFFGVQVSRCCFAEELRSRLFVTDER